MPRYGLSKYEVNRILQEVLKREPDLVYYLDNCYIEKLTGLLTEGIAEVIERNNEKIINDIARDTKRRF